MINNSKSLAEQITALQAQLLDETETEEAWHNAVKDLANIYATSNEPKALEVLHLALKQNANTSTRLWLISILERYALIESISALVDAENNDDSPDVYDAAGHALGEAVEILARQLEEEATQAPAKKNLERIGFDFIHTLLTSLEEDYTIVAEVRQRAAAVALVELSPNRAVSLLAETLESTQKPNLVISILSLLRQVGGAEVIKPISRRLIDVNRKVRQRAAQVLQQLGSEESLPALATAFIIEEDYDVRKTIEEALADLDDWERKAKIIVENLDTNHKEREDIDARQIITAINFKSQNTRNKHALTSYLIRETIEHYSEDRSSDQQLHYRMTAVMAALIIASTGENISLANKQLDDYKKKRSDHPESSLRLLRTELNPALRALQYNLEANFQIPINELNQETKETWRTTVEKARQGFIIRVYMSIITFGIGLILVVVSSIILFRDPSNILVGPSISFVSGIVTMLLTIFRGPLNEIRRSVSDLGIASAAFIAYIHRVLQISLTFSYHYLNQTIDFKNMEASSQLMEQVMKSTVDQFNLPDKSSQKPES